MNLHKCTTCNEIKDCKPAGINGALVCLKCAKKEPKLLRLFLLRSVGFTEEDERYFHDVAGFDAYAGDSTAHSVGEAVCHLIGRAISKAHEMGVDIKSVESKVLDSYGDTDQFAVAFTANAGHLAMTLGEDVPVGQTKNAYLPPGKYDA